MGPAAQLAQRRPLWPPYPRRADRAAAFWHDHDRSEADLYTGTRLANALDWRNNSRPQLSQLEFDFLNQSAETAERLARKAEEQQRREEEQLKQIAEEQRLRAEEQAKLVVEQKKRAEEAETASSRLRNRRNIAFGLAAIGLTVAAVAVYFFFESRNNEALAKERADIANSQALAAEAGEPNVKTKEIDLLLAIESNLISEEGKDFTPNLGFGAIHNLSTLFPISKSVLKHDGPVNETEWNADESLILTRSSDGTAKLWNAESGALIHTLSHDAYCVVSRVER